MIRKRELKIINKNRDFIISDSCGIADSFLFRFLGLMFSGPRDLVLKSRVEDVTGSSIHMMFMRFSIDVLWLNSEMQVVDVKRKIPPFNIFKGGTWKIYKPGSPARYVVEIGGGGIGDTEIGDGIEFLS